MEILTYTPSRYDGMVDIADLKSVDPKGRAGSSPVTGTMQIPEPQTVIGWLLSLRPPGWQIRVKDMNPGATHITFTELDIPIHQWHIVLPTEQLVKCRIPKSMALSILNKFEAAKANGFINSDS